MLPEKTTTKLVSTEKETPNIYVIINKNDIIILCKRYIPVLKFLKITVFSFFILKWLIISKKP